MVNIIQFKKQTHRKTGSNACFLFAVLSCSSVPNDKTMMDNLLLFSLFYHNHYPVYQGILYLFLGQIVFLNSFLFPLLQHQVVRSFCRFFLMSLHQMHLLQQLFLQNMGYPCLLIVLGSLFHHIFHDGVLLLGLYL